MNKKIDCPLCHAIGVITCTEPELVTTVSAHRRKEDVVVGGYTRDYEGGGMDYSHADVCPKLVKAFDKRALLGSYVYDPEFTREDSRSFEDWEQALLVCGIGIGMDAIRNTKKKRWDSQCFLYSKVNKQSGLQYNKAEANNSEAAFALLKHRLLCGELIHITNPPVQIIPGEALRFQSVKM